MYMASSRERLTNELFQKALSDSLKDLIYTTGLNDEQKCCLPSVAERKYVFGILQTGFRKSLIFQMLLPIINVLWKLE